MSGYDSLMKKIKKYSYKKENWGVLACYSISEQEVKKLNLVSNEYFKFALSENLLSKISIFPAVSDKPALLMHML